MPRTANSSTFLESDKPDEWERATALFNVDAIGPQRTKDSLKQLYGRLKVIKKPTGNSRPSEMAKKVREIEDAIASKTCSFELGGYETSDLEDESEDIHSNGNTFLTIDNADLSSSSPGPSSSGPSSSSSGAVLRPFPESSSERFRRSLSMPQKGSKNSGSLQKIVEAFTSVADRIAQNLGSAEGLDTTSNIRLEKVETSVSSLSSKVDTSVSSLSEKVDTSVSSLSDKVDTCMSQIHSMSQEVQKIGGVLEQLLALGRGRSRDDEDENGDDLKGKRPRFN
ncbi:hypothetical protein [Parasitella parasitica]|uniref:Uncharacterized protein n=1 Tax=Parasitella parasitica TaxID=35722 RepID=A0A0B7N3D1_9FUNG|nr:hypothetical protein [Parasitella parasitica]